MPRTFFPAIKFKRNRELAISACITARAWPRALMRVGIAYPRWQGKRFQHSRRMRIRNFTYLARGPWTGNSLPSLTPIYGQCAIMPLLQPVGPGIRKPVKNKPRVLFEQLSLMHILNVDNRCINSSHRMGQANGDILCKILVKFHANCDSGQFFVCEAGQGEDIICVMDS